MSGYDEGSYSADEGEGLTLNIIDISVGFVTRKQYMDCIRMILRSSYQSLWSELPN